MTCPDCQSGLYSDDVNGVDVDRCEGCGGVWFGSGGLRRARRAPKGGARTRFSRFIPNNVPAGPCPQCKGSTLIAGALDGLAVARCGACMGVWGSTPPSPPERESLFSASHAGAAGADVVVEAAFVIFDLFN
jgi:Zn-finger nucleic acid-binding protein